MRRAGPDFTLSRRVPPSPFRRASIIVDKVVFGGSERRPASRLHGRLARFPSWLGSIWQLNCIRVSAKARGRRRSP